jgi:hypothetical protein
MPGGGMPGGGIPGGGTAVETCTQGMSLGDQHCCCCCQQVERTFCLLPGGGLAPGMPGGGMPVGTGGRICGGACNCTAHSRQFIVHFAGKTVHPPCLILKPQLPQQKC